MSYGGHVLDMINRMKQNDALRKSRRDRHAKIKDSFEKHQSLSPNGSMRQTELPREEMDEIKLRIRYKLIRDRKIFLLKSALVMLFLLLLTILFFKYLM